MDQQDPEFVFLSESKKTKSLTFIIKNVDTSIVNGIRRIIMSEIPCAAIPFDSNGNNPLVNVKDNFTMMDNEYLLNRISLIPLNFSPEEIDSFEEENFLFVLKKKNTGSEVVNVTTADFTILNRNGELYSEAIKNQIFEKNPITEDNILITKLKPNLQDVSHGNSIHLEAYAEINIGKHHARWQPTSNVSFFNQIDEEKANKELENRLKNANPQEAELIRQTFVLDRQRYFKTDKKGNCNQFQFNIESITTNLSPRYLFAKALDIIVNKFNSLLQLEKFNITQINPDFSLILFDDDKYGYDVLQLLTRSINGDLVGKRKPSNLSLYAGYYQQHPLDSKMILKIKLKPGTDLNDFLKDEIKIIVRILENVKEIWSKF